ncbi:MAG: hypothetical protein ACI9M9_002364, partial [Flavobacteriaceae bacterium]
VEYSFNTTAIIHFKSIKSFSINPVKSLEIQVPKLTDHKTFS